MLSTGIISNLILAFLSLITTPALGLNLSEVCSDNVAVLYLRKEVSRRPCLTKAVPYYNGKELLSKIVRFIRSVESRKMAEFLEQLYAFREYKNGSSRYFTI